MNNDIENTTTIPIKNTNKKAKFPILGVIISFIFAFALTFLGTNDVLGEAKIPVEAYRVYLKGESIGLIKSESELYDYINKMQQAIKDKYNVSKVYIPNDIKVIKDITYDDKIISISEIYNIINQKSPFTIKGYIATIDKTKTTEYLNEDEESTSEKEKIIKINLLDDDLLYNATKKVVLSFVSEEEYDNFVNETQSAIVDTGEIIEDLYIEDVVTTKEAYIPVNEKIYTNEEELTSYLLFGKDSNMSTYTVKEGDTLEKIAENNKMNVNEILIANTNLRTAEALLYEGQKLTVGILNPVFTTVEQTHKVEDQVVKYKTEYIYDNTKLTGYQSVQTKGSNGITRITQKVKSVNGEVINSIISSKEELKPVVNEVIVKGGKKPIVVSAGNWGWPTNLPYTINSRYGWRRGSLHAGVDIGGQGEGAPIYAAKAGIVTEVSYHPATGYYVVINHQNGYYSRYGHMKSLSRYVKKGDYVNMGDTIGDIGHTGRASGNHLHLEIWRGAPYAPGSQSYDPLLFY